MDQDTPRKQKHDKAETLADTCATDTTSDQDSYEQTTITDLQKVLTSATDDAGTVSSPLRGAGKTSERNNTTSSSSEVDSEEIKAEDVPVAKEPMACPQRAKQDTQDEMKRQLLEWYPDLLSQVHCVPPCIMNRIQYVRKVIAGQSVLIAVPTSRDISTSSGPDHPPDQEVETRTSSAISEAQAEHPEKDNLPRMSRHHLDTASTTQTLHNSPMSQDLTSTAHERQENIQNASILSQSPDLPLGGHSADLTREICRDSKQQDDTSQKLNQSTEEVSRQEEQIAHQSVLQDQTKEASQQTCTQPTTYSAWTAEKDPTAQPMNVQETDTRDDFAQQHVLFCLQKLGQQLQEPMFLVSELEFSSYLSKLDSASAARFPLPLDLHRRGEFDVIVVHPTHGVLLGEIKSLGFHEDTLTDAVVVKKVRQAIKQLEKCEAVFTHTMSDLSPNVAVRKTLVLPYITRASLKRALATSDDIQEELCRCLGASSVHEAVELCLCSDHLSVRSTPWLVDASVLTPLNAWWSRRMTSTVNANMTPEAYIDVLSRVAGPATTVTIHCVIPPRVELHTHWEAVSEMGERLAYLVLTPAQLDLLTRSPRTVCILGPPGTGKSVVLMVKGLSWLRRGHNVLVLSTYASSLAMAHLVRYQLRKTVQADVRSGAGTVLFRHYDLYLHPEKVESAIEELVAVSAGSTPYCVLMDEANFRYKNVGPATRRLVAELSARVPHLCLWAASVTNTDIPPQLQVETLTVPLRCAAAVVREVQTGIDAYTPKVHAYSCGSTPSPCDGPSVIKLRHQGAGHAGRWPVECFQCGQEVAGVLKRLRVGVTDSGQSVFARPTTSPPPLQYRDVFVLTRSSELREEKTDKDTGQVTSPASGVVRGLREAGVPVRVVGWMKEEGVARWEEGVREMAVPVEDHVTVATFAVTHGLERKVVVYLPGRWGVTDEGRSADYIEAEDRVYLASRCTTQLVMVKMPRGEDDIDFGNNST